MPAFHSPCPQAPTCSTVLAANASTRSQWKTNQCVAIGCKSSSQLVVTSRQSRSTPGIYTELQLRPQIKYRVELFGQSLQCTKAFVFVYNPITKERLIPNYSLLPTSPNCSVCGEFVSPSSACHAPTVKVWVGALFTGPPRNGQQFCLTKVKLTELPMSRPDSDNASPGSACAVPCPPGCPPPGCPPPGCPPPGCPPPVAGCVAVPHTESDSEDDSSCSDDDEDSDTVYHHHHQVFNMNQQDPYYTYGTQPCPQAPKPYTQQQAATTPTGTCPVQSQSQSSAATHPLTTSSGASSTSAHGTTAAHEPLCISDLQTSLGTLIKQMKG